MQIEQLCPYIRVAIDSVLDASWKIDERVIWDYELLYLMEGQLLVTVEGETYKGRAGDYFFFKPGQTHAIQVIGGMPIRQPHVHFDLFAQPDSREVGVSFKPLKQMNAKERGWLRPNELDTRPYFIPSHFRPGDPLPLEQALFELIREFETKPPFHELRMKSRLLDILSLIMREQYWGSKALGGGQLELLSEIRSYIDHNAHRNVNLDELEDRFHISKFYLIHLFKNVFQRTPIQYHQQIRMEKAKTMIQYTYLSFQEISDQLGYSSIHAFSRAFKSYEGCSPSRYRETISG
ncbi:AraC family transcriptional regulator [Paenibacillus rhizovicinus]|uniref:AraC family transcriptional regulator n=1 Tax=Paenibacillus rhizovicinus TaxID=2704463 RepID=A0A6C0P702_9BACL|nr:AraC family transcriptional regulator [Paenibacillus rhizovicinus]QHW34370.1 AraC family transcriptional regulator [Paenibacillus rhizovicinus]